MSKYTCDKSLKDTPGKIEEIIEKQKIDYK